MREWRWKLNKDFSGREGNRGLLKYIRDLGRGERGSSLDDNKTMFSLWETQIRTSRISWGYAVKVVNKHPNFSLYSLLSKRDDVDQ